jgi:metal-responsive CopG/Arc/MetJ family transcriptional regulator
MAPKPKHRLSPVKIPIELNQELEECREKLGHTHTQAIEEAVRLYVRAAKRKPRPEQAED